MPYTGNEFVGGDDVEGEYRDEFCIPTKIRVGIYVKHEIELKTSIGVFL